MSIESVIYDRLSGHAGLSALVSTRVYPNVAPQNVTVPFVTYRRVSALRESGYGEDIGIVTSRFQIDMYATTYSGVRAIAEQVRAATQRYRASGTDPEVIDTFIENELETFEAEPALLHHAVTDIRIHYRE